MQAGRFRVAMLHSSILASAASLLFAGAAFAQAAAPGTAAPAAEADIVVTGTRLQVNGYQQPTPVSVIGVEKLERDNKTDLASVIADFPSVGPSQSANSGLNTQSLSANTAGLSLVNLRNLGVARTLVLFDGIRVAPSAEGGGADLNQLPSSLVQRIDVVTGGASAAYGSDAVSGVVNVILNKKFTGLAAHAEGASNEKGTRQQAKAELSFGTNVGERGHLILSGSYLYSPDRVIPTETDWFDNQGLIGNPAYTSTNGQPRYIHAKVGAASATQGGVILTGPLAGTQFIGNGTPVPFVIGNVSGTVQNGGTFINPVYNGQVHNLTTPMRALNLFGHFSQELTDSINFNFELNYGKTISNTNGPSYVRNGTTAVVIKQSNPYLDPGLAAQMLNQGIASFALNTFATNNAVIQNGDEPNAYGIGNWNGDSTRTLFRQVASLDGTFKLGSEWHWNIDAQHSEVHRHSHINGNPITARYNLAVDAVRVTSANVGTSGLAIGSIACASTLTAPTNGCRPLNIMGIGVADPAAIAWIQGTTDGPGMTTDLYFKQWTASGAVRGEPVSTWAGPVAVALGVDYRKDSLLQTADPLSYARAYTLSNRQYINASQNSIEGYGEIGVPLVKDGFVKSLDLNGAYRFTHYSSSGDVSTWKVGATSQIIDDIRVRATYSRDIRQPSILDLYDPGSSQAQNVPDPFNGGLPTAITTLIAGNPNLKPEKARTFTAGVVLTPTFLPGLSASVDYYAINIKDALFTPNVQQVLDNCTIKQNANFCALLTKDSLGHLTGLLVGPVNAASSKTAGFDFQLDYRFAALGGDMNFSVLGNYITRLSTDSLGNVSTPLNSLNSAQAGPNKFRSTFTLSYKANRWGTTAQVRTIGAGNLNTLWGSSGPNSVDDNHVPAVAYLDLRANYYVDSAKRINFYAAMDNVLNRKPPIIPNDPTSAFAYFFVPTRTELYDFLGRQLRVGVRAKF